MSHTLSQSQRQSMLLKHLSYNTTDWSLIEEAVDQAEDTEAAVRPASGSKNLSCVDALTAGFRLCCSVLQIILMGLQMGCTASMGCAGYLNKDTGTFGSHGPVMVVLY